MREIDIRALEQSASAMVDRARAGEVITVTDGGLPVARLVPIPESNLDRLLAAGMARPPRRQISELPTPVDAGARLSDGIADLRDDDRF